MHLREQYTKEQKETSKGTIPKSVQEPSDVGARHRRGGRRYAHTPPVTTVQLNQGTLEAIASMVAAQLRQSGEFRGGQESHGTRSDTTSHATLGVQARESTEGIAQGEPSRVTDKGPGRDGRSGATGTREVRNRGWLARETGSK